MFFKDNKIKLFHQNKKIDIECLKMELNIPVIKLNVSSVKLKINETFQLIASVTNSNDDLFWESSNTGMATVSQEGLVSCIHEGDLQIKVSLKNNLNIFAICDLKITDSDSEIPDVIDRTITGILINNEIEEMEIGEDLSIMATCLPYDVFDENPYTLSCDNDDILLIDNSSIISAIGEGRVTLTATTPNGHTDSITFNVVDKKEEYIPSIEEIYNVNLSSFNIVEGNVDLNQAKINSIGFNNLLDYSSRHNYKKIVLPNGTYQLDPKQTIYGRSNIVFDLNDSTLQIKPNSYISYSLLNFEEGNYSNLISDCYLDDASIGQNDDFIVESEKTLQSNMIEVTEYPDKDDNNQLILCARKNDLFKIKYSINAIRNSILDSNTSSSLSCSIFVEYYMDNEYVSSDFLGNLWIRSLEQNGLSSNHTTENYKLKNENNYNNIRFVAKYSTYNCICTIIPIQLSLCRISTNVLENFKIINGTILGERDYKSEFLPNWSSNPSTEGACSIVFNEGNNNGIENLTVKKSIGFNMSSGLGGSAYGAIDKRIPVSYTNLEWGDFNQYGENIESTLMQRTINMIDISLIQEQFSFGMNLGYMGYNLIRARIYDIYFYDENKQFISRKRGIRTFMKTKKPKNAKYIHLSLHWNLAQISSGDSDFSGAIGFINELKSPYKNFIKNCIIEDNYSTGFAQCGGTNWLIENNTFRNNGGRMPGCDIDWEDGWEFVQDDIVRNNNFESYNTLIICAGLNFALKDNIIKGNMTQWARSLQMKWSNNIFKNPERNVSASFGTSNDMYVCNNKFGGGTVSASRQHETAKYNVIWDNNEFDNTNYIYQCSKNNIIKNNIFNNNVSVRADLKDCTINNGITIHDGSINNCLVNGNISFGNTKNVSDLVVSNSTLTNCKFSYANRGFDINNCNWINDGSLLEVYNETNKIEKIRNCNITINNPTVNLVDSYNTGPWIGNNLYINNNNIIVPNDYSGYYFKASWRGDGSNEINNIIIENNTSNVDISIAPQNHLNNCGLNFIVNNNTII